MLIATKQQGGGGDYHPWTACAGHPTNKQAQLTHPWRKGRKRILINNVRLGISETIADIIQVLAYLFGEGLGT